MDDKKDLAEIFLDTNHLFYRYNMAWYGRNFGGIDPKQGQGRILSALRRMNSVSQKELGTILKVRPQSLGELLQKLETNGYIERRRSTIDKRSLIIDLTEKGETFQLNKPDYEEIFGELSDDERETLKNVLEKISTNLELLIQRESILAKQPTPTESDETAESDEPTESPKPDESAEPAESPEPAESAEPPTD